MGADSHFIGEKTEVQRGDVTSPTTHSFKPRKWDLNPGDLSPECCFFL